MIAFLKGPVLQIQPQALVLNAGGVGYRVFVPTPLLGRAIPGTELTLHVHYHFTDASGPSLFGFEEMDHLSFFEDLLSVSGVGPKIALAILSQTPIDDTKRSIVHGDASALQRVSGVGKKTGERIVLELKNKITMVTAEPLSGQTSGSDDALDALLSLGFTRTEAVSALQGVDPSLPAGARVKLALQQSGKV